MYNQFFTIKPRISEKNGGSKVIHLIEEIFDKRTTSPSLENTGDHPTALRSQRLYPEANYSNYESISLLKLYEQIFLT